MEITQKSALAQQAYASEIESTKPPEVNVNKEENVGAVKQAGDTVSLSQDARDIQLAKDAVEEAPEVREEVVQDLKKEVDNGTYNINSNDIADKMVGSNIDEVV